MTAHPAESSRQAIITAARELFAERGYNQVTIRDVASRVQLSPAMVMKCVGSKKELFYEAATLDPPALPDVAVSDLGRELVRRLLVRFDEDAIEHLGRAVVLRLSAPDPDAVRARFVSGYVEPLAARLGGDDDARMRADLVVAAMLGLAAALRLFELVRPSAPADDVVRAYGGMLQALIDG